MVEATHFVLPRGRHSMVKEAEFFRGQGGERENWGKHWRPVVVPEERRDPRRDPHGIEMARRLAAHMPVMDGFFKRCWPLLPPVAAVEPDCGRYQQVADRGLLG